MAPLYGRLQGNRGEATRMGYSDISTQVETWQGKVSVDLFKDGTFYVRLGGKHDTGKIIAAGNVGNDPDYGRWAKTEDYGIVPEDAMV